MCVWGWSLLDTLQVCQIVGISQYFYLPPVSSSKNTKLSFISFVGLLKEASNRIYSIISKKWKTKWLKKDWQYNFLPEMNLSKTNLGNSFLASSHKNNIEIKNIDININKNNWIIQWSQLSISSTVSNILNFSYFVNKVKQIIVHNHLTHTHILLYRHEM